MIGWLISVFFGFRMLRKENPSTKLIISVSIKEDLEHNYIANFE